MVKRNKAKEIVESHEHLHHEEIWHIKEEIRPHYKLLLYLAYKVYPIIKYKSNTVINII